MNSSERFLKESLQHLADEQIVHDIGGGQSPQDRARFKQYVVVDVRAEYHPDILADIHHLPFTDNSLGAITCFSVLEHVQNPEIACQELLRVLRPGGKLLVTVPFIWPYHGSTTAGPDYWRFTDDGLRLLFRNFSYIEIVKSGGYFSALANFLPFSSYFYWLFRPLSVFLDFFLSLRSTTSGYIVFLEK